MRLANFSGVAARRAAASAASAGAWKPHGRRAEAGRDEDEDEGEGEGAFMAAPSLSVAAAFFREPLVAGLAMARAYPGGSRDDRPRGASRLSREGGVGERPFAAVKERAFAAASRSLSIRATRFAFAASSAAARVRATASRAATRRAEPSEEARVALPNGDGDGRDAISCTVSFSSLSARRSSSAAITSRSSATPRRRVSRRRARACFTRSSACFVVGRGETKKSPLEPPSRSAPSKSSRSFVSAADETSSASTEASSCDTSEG
jgi:hypothetical protein